MWKIMFTIFSLVVFLCAQNVDSWRRRRRRRAPPPCSARDCRVSSWSTWSSCSHQCGTSGSQRRTRAQTSPASCGGSCPYTFDQTRACNRDKCQNGGTPHSSGCSCRSGYQGRCCEGDVNECQRNPCQHTCTNTFGSYTCQCHSCYTKLGTRCELRQCKISGSCYAYGAVNPSNKCQDCNSANKIAWTNNDALPCSDGVACTRNDRCSGGGCSGTPFTCLPCEECYNDACRVKPGYCVIQDGGVKKCFTHGTLRPGYQCQQCDSNNKYQWTNNNNLKCSDNNLKTKDDRCISGACVGTPYNCLPCETHDGRGCPINPGHCIIQNGNQRTCYAKNHYKPGNPCQWCNPSSSTSTWTNREGVACDDGDKCTRGDTCRSGQCSATPFTCNSGCQYCNGYTCSLKTGFGFVNNKCMCKIAGQDYGHQTLNPSNQCQWCDLDDPTARANSAWSNRPTVACDDQDACTQKDTCNAGRCVGQPYSCQSSHPSSSCIKTSQCVGDGTCRDIMRATGIICRPPVDVCDQPERCDGNLGTCPGAVQDRINIRTGTAKFMDSTFQSVVSYQHLTDKLYLRVSGFSVSCGHLTFRWFLLSASSTCNTASPLNGTFPNSNSQQTITGLILQDTNSYKVSIQAWDIRNNVPQLVCSGVVVIDTSKPQDGWIRDGSGADLSYQDTKLLRVNWGGVKTRNGVRKYDWKVLITPFDTNQTIELMPFTTVHQNTSAQKSFNSITDGSKVKFVVRAYTKAGLFSDLTSDGVVIDTSPPIAGKVYDGNQVGFDLKFAKWAKTFSANWDIFTDSHSPISRYNWAVERVGTGLITSFKDTDLNRISTATNLNLVSGESYCAVVTGYNEAGLPTTVKSDCVLIDHDVPIAGTVNDGHFHDVDYQSEDTMIAANWNGFSDGSKGSGIVEYRYKVTEDGGGIIVPWTSAGNATNITLNGLVLKNNTKYFVTVKVVDAVGLSTDITTDGVTVDTTHPVFTGKVVVTGVNDVKNGTSCVYISSISSVKVQWIGFSDAHSGLQRYEWAIIPSDKSLSNSDLTEVSGSNLPTSATFQNLVLIQGKEYYVVVRAYNRAKLYKDAYSVLVIPDSTPPSPGEVFDGPTYKVDIDYQAEIHHVYGSWENFPEPHTAVKQYYYAVGSCITGNYHVSENAFVKLDPPTATSFVLSNVTLVNGQRYCVKIKAENKAGLFSNEVSSDGFVADVTPPDTRNAQVRDGMTGSDIDFQDNTTALSAQWDGFADRESGIHYYEYGIGKSRGRNADVFYFKNIGLNTSATAGGLSLSDDVYYFIVCAVNKAGLRQCLSSDGVLIDFSPPSLGVVHDGIIEPDLTYQSSLSSMAANWEGIWDLESGIEKFEWSIGTSTNDKTSVQSYIDAGLSTHVKSKAVLSLSSGTKYFVHLKVTNQAGAVRELVSDGVIADGTPPKPSVIYPGFGSQGEWTYSDQESSFYSASASSIAAYWTRFAEPESEVWYYKWAIGTSKCGTQVQPLVNIGRLNYANTTTTDLVFRSGIKYYVTITSRNRAGLVSRSCSDALVFDSTPPRAGKVYVGQSSNSHRTKTFHNGKGIIISWKEFRDRESGISECNISVENQVGGVPFFHSSNETLGNISLPHHVHLFHGQSYNATVECTNHADLTSSSSTTFVIDDTPPIQNGPIIAGVSRDQHYQYQSDKTSVTATWPPFTDPESDIRNYQFAMGTRPSLDDIISFEDVHLATRVNKNGLRLLQGAVYYITVIATNFAGSSTNVSSLALRIDTTPPLGVNGCVHDGPSGDDIDFFSPNIDLAAHWEEVNDAESSIVESKYCIGTKPRGCQIQTTRSVQGNKSFICPTCKANPGERVFVTVTATNGAGLSVTRSSNGMVLDVTAPRMGSVIDGSHVTGVDYNVVLEEWNVSMSWFGVEDPESGVKSCLWRVQDADGYTVLENEISNNTVYGQKKVFTRPQTYLELNFLKNVTYYNVITCWSKAQLHSTARSNGFRMESVWPVPASVRNGKKQGVNLIYTTSTRIIGANWDPFTSDMTDPVVDYEWAVGTAVGKNDILRFTSVGLKTSIEKDLAPNAPGVDVLVAGQKHYITIKATSAAGLTSMASSSGFIVDPSPPVKAEVITSHVVTDQKQRIVEIHVSWDGTQDYESGIESSDYCLGTTPLTCVDGATRVGPSTTGTIGPFKPELQAGYYVTVIVANRAGLTSVMSSKKLIFDSTPPTQGTVVDGLGQDIDFTDSMNSLPVQWEGFEDEETGIASCAWSLIEQSASDNSSAFGNDTVVLTESVPSRGNLTRVNLNLVPGARYVSKITCSNGDGFNSTSFSDGIVVDVTAASSGLVHDGSSLKTDMQYQSSSSEVEAIWEPFKDQESGVVKYRWSVGTSPDRTDVLNFTDVDIKTSAKTSNLTLTHRQRYYVTVEATNGAGITSHGWSDGFLVDISPPLLTELSSSSNVWLGPKDSLSASWKSSDPESDVIKTEFCVGSISIGCQIKSMSELPPNATNVSCDDCQLTHLGSYYVTIQVTNGAGLFTVATTNEIKVDLTSPVLGDIVHVTDVTPCVNNCTLIANISSFLDNESGIKLCRYAIRNSSHLLGDFVNNGLDKTLRAAGLQLQTGERYYFVVRCENTVGLVTEKTSIVPVLVDNTPPKKGSVIVSADRTHDVFGIHSSCHLFNTTLRAHWFGFNDDESGISGFRVAVGKKPNAVDILPFHDVGMTTNVTLPLNNTSGLFDGDIVYVTVESSNQAGLTTYSSSPPTRLISADSDAYTSEGDFYCYNV